MSTHRSINPSIFYVGNPVALITTLSPDGTANIGPMSSAWALGHNIVLGWEATAQTTANLERTGECVINYPGPGQWDQVDAIATLTGHNPPAPHKADQFRYTSDKWTPSGFTPQPAELVAPPRIAECPLQCEAEVVACHAPAAGEDGGFGIVETRILRIHAAHEILTPGTDHIDTEAWSPLLYVFRDYFGTGSRLGTSVRR